MEETQQPNLPTLSKGVLEDAVRIWKALAERVALRDFLDQNIREISELFQSLPLENDIATNAGGLSLCWSREKQLLLVNGSPLLEATVDRKARVSPAFESMFADTRIEIENNLLAIKTDAGLSVTWIGSEGGEAHPIVNKS